MLSALSWVAPPLAATMHTGEGRVDTPPLSGSLTLAMHGEEHGDHTLLTSQYRLGHETPVHWSTDWGLGSVARHSGSPT